MGLAMVLVAVLLFLLLLVGITALVHWVMV